jgi:bacillithiol biosynthesis cysteine-adding enzyme BshC
MAIYRTNYADIPQLSDRDKAYQSDQNPFESLISYKPELASFIQAIEDRKKYPVDRTLIVNVLNEQYKDIANCDLSKQNIELLRSENTFTVITAHQPVLFTGPLYYIIKIYSAINMAEKLKETHPAYDFVPVFISGGEDHDFDEVNSCNLYGKTIEWNQDKTGSVGRMNLDGIQEAITALEDILSDKENAQRAKKWINEAYSNSASYAEFTNNLVNRIFSKYGLVTLNPDHKDLKASFASVMKKELLEQSSAPLVQQTQSTIEALGYKTQAFARDINLFYLQQGSRERIELDNGEYKILNTALTFTEEEILLELDNHPERFSPNVIMRPMYQETILPNLAYIGGGGELAYWIERKSQFSEFSIFFPILIRRASAMLITSGNAKNMDKLNISVDRIFHDEDRLIADLVNAESEVNLSLAEQLQSVDNVFQSIAARAKIIDPTLEGKVLAEGNKQLKIIEHLELRLRRTVKAQQETEVNKIRKIKSSLFPNNGLQERHDNFFQYYDMYGDQLLDLMKENIDAFDKNFITIEL